MLYLMLVVFDLRSLTNIRAEEKALGSASWHGREIELDCIELFDGTESSVCGF